MSRFIGWSSHGIRRTGWNLDPRTALSGLALVCGLALLAAFYLVLASQTALLGRRLQEMEEGRLRIVRENAHLEDQIARASSVAKLRQRAIVADFVTPGTVIFVPTGASQYSERDGQDGAPP